MANGAPGSLITNEYVRDVDWFSESVTVTTTGVAVEAVPEPAAASVGVPVMVPVAALRLRPDGNPTAAQVYGGTPPAAAKVNAGYGVQIVPCGGAPLVMTGSERQVTSAGL